MDNSCKSLKEVISNLIMQEYASDYSLLLNLIKPTIGIRKSTNKAISKFGGNPFFPPNFVLNKNFDKSLTFLCQIAVDEYLEYDKYGYLPKSYMLYFYINTKLDYPIKKEDFKVLCLSVEKGYLEEQRNNENRIAELFIEFFTHYNFPSYQSYEILELNLDDFELDQKIEDLQEFINNYNKITLGCEGSQLYGNPQALQGNVSFHWALQSLNLDYQLTDYELNKVKNIEKEFVLLLQIDLSDLNIIDDFGDGVLYFGIRKEDLRKKDFSKVELVYQAT